MNPGSGGGVRDDLELRCVPGRDRGFQKDVERLAGRIPPDLDAEAALAWFEVALRRDHPDAHVEQMDQRERSDRPIVVWYASRDGHAFPIDTEVQVPLVPAQAFEVYVERVVEWQTAVDLERTDTSAGLVGREYRASYPILGLHTTGAFRVVGADPPRMVSLEAAGSGITVWYTTRFSPRPDGALVTVQGDYRLPGNIIGRMVDRLGLQGAIRRDIEHANESYRRLCIAVAVEQDLVFDREPDPTGIPAWSATLSRFEAAQARYRGALRGDHDPADLAAAQAELMAARGQVEALKRSALGPRAAPGDEHPSESDLADVARGARDDPA